jgi:hypothetical protein
MSHYWRTEGCDGVAETSFVAGEYLHGGGLGLAQLRERHLLSDGRCFRASRDHGADWNSALRRHRCAALVIRPHKVFCKSSGNFATLTAILRASSRSSSFAKRERQARVILGDSERQVAEKFGEAAKTYADNATAFHLWAMNMLYGGLKKNNATIVIVPSTAVETTQLGGLAGVTALTAALGHEKRFRALRRVHGLALPKRNRERAAG